MNKSIIKHLNNQNKCSDNYGYHINQNNIKPFTVVFCDFLHFVNINTCIWSKLQKYGDNNKSVSQILNVQNIGK